MSADNWTDCPKCKDTRAAELDAAQARVDLAYGKVPADEWDALRTAAAREAARLTGGTFREDWELGLFEGNVYISYRGSCAKCGLSTKYVHEYKLWPES